MDKYYVIQNKETGFYFRGKGANRWGKYHNQASVYRMKAHAENTLGWLLRRGEPVEIVPIQIVENPTDFAKVVRCKDCKNRGDVANCPMCFEEEKEWDDDGYTEVDWFIYDRTYDDGFCSRGERREK